MFFSSEGFPTRNTYALSPVITDDFNQSIQLEGDTGSHLIAELPKCFTMIWSATPSILSFPFAHMRGSTAPPPLIIHLITN